MRGVGWAKNHKNSFIHSKVLTVIVLVIVCKHVLAIFLLTIVLKSIQGQSERKKEIYRLGKNNNRSAGVGGGG